MTLQQIATQNIKTFVKKNLIYIHIYMYVYVYVPVRIRIRQPHVLVVLDVGPMCIIQHGMVANATVVNVLPHGTSGMKSHPLQP